LFIYLFSGTGKKPRASCILGKCYTFLP
jgi:hypothetical protein